VTTLEEMGQESVNLFMYLDGTQDRYGIDWQ